jgi:mannose-6-phosphate isomerase
VDDETAPLCRQVTPPPAILNLRDRLKAWLLERAFPVWWDPGADHAEGGFHDRLDIAGKPIAGVKRARVAARQVFSYAVAGEMGWRGPWRAALDHGLAFLEAGHRRPDGLYRSFAGDRDDRVDLYDQAFVLLSLASASRMDDEAAAKNARALLALLPREATGGFASLDGAGPEANPNMHLFEAFLVWTEAEPSGPWRELAAGQTRLAMTRLIDSETGALSEHFGPGWTAPPAAERVVEPGHLFEWAWLLLRGSLISGDSAAFAVATRLIEVAERSGVDPARRVAVNTLSGDLDVFDAGTRLWPQTERLRVALLAGVLTGDASFWEIALAAAAGLDVFLNVPTPGLWRDSLESDDFSAPASSLYHIVGAIRQLDAAADGRPA